MVEVGAVGLSEEGPDALARNATPEERERLNTALVELPATIADTWSSDWIRGAAVKFQAMLLEAGGQNDEALLKLYRDAELWQETTTMLLEMGQVKEATSLAARKLTQAHDLIDFADQLLALGDGHVDDALTHVDARLWEIEGTDPRQDAYLLQWLAAAYTRHDRPKQALVMAQRSFAIRSDLAMYAEVKSAATLPSQPTGTWPAVQRELVKTLETQKAWPALLDIHLAEGNAKAALRALAQSERGQHGGSCGGLLPWYGAATIEIRVAELAERDVPDEAIRLYRRAADRLIEARERTSYRQAAEYLARIKRLLETNGRADEWRQLIADLRATHKTLRALRDELDARDLQ